MNSAITEMAMADFFTRAMMLTMNEAKTSSHGITMAPIVPRNPAANWSLGWVVVVFASAAIVTPLVTPSPIPMTSASIASTKETTPSVALVFSGGGGAATYIGTGTAAGGGAMPAEGPIAHGSGSE